MMAWRDNSTRTVEIQKAFNEKLGIRVACLPSGEGVVVAHIEPGSPAYTQSNSLKRGDVITHINGEMIPGRNKDDAVRVIATRSNETVIRFTVIGNTDPDTSAARAHSISTHNETSLTSAYIKAPFAIVLMGLLFFVSIFEGIGRVISWSCRTRWNSMLKLQQVEHINTSFELMMSVWYDWVWQDPTFGLNPSKAVHRSESLL
eukprot:m.215385 g.215385  ORF g.215385 m.215385 type:complete len:203 (-) comp17198_c0_seq10:3382-3990(-)